MKSLLFIALGGSLGALARYFIALAFSREHAVVFPWGILLVNCLGCLLIGLVYAFILYQSLVDKNLSLFLVTGFCGGFTTFSTFSYDLFSMLSAGRFTDGAIYLTLSVLGGLACVFLGLLAGKYFIFNPLN